VWPPPAEASGKDEDQARSGRLLLLAKEQSWRTAWHARSALSRTNLSSGSERREHQRTAAHRALQQ
jgi:hypothetical protein